MKFYKKRVFWLILLTIVLFSIWTIYFYKENFKIYLELTLPTKSKDFVAFFWALIALFSWLFWWLYKLDLQEEKEKHLWYIRTINDRINKKIDWNFFTDIEKARKFCDKEEYYILPFWFKYNTSNIDFKQNEYNSEADNDEEKIEKFKKLSLEEILNNEELLYEREFLDFNKYIKNLDLHWKNKFNKESKIIVENYFEKNNIKNDDLINLFQEWKDFVIIEWYCYLYKL